ncbi:MAG: hypothetical protein HS104_22445 [Polyangiaceae bacterium]|nr:hypothetical protein [Polyangiaceae bacterium]MCE7894312.1 hypothetical protein [Sorangiineae bacterium PRO1]MCL4750049.1 hypothetical protein [Myxococcales bacterium]
MKATFPVASLLVCLVAAGCTAEMAPEDAVLLEDGQDEPAAFGEAEASEEETEEPVSESAEALCSCATTLHCSNGQLTVYEHSSCCGGKFFFCPGNYPDLTKYTNNLGWGANWNDRISRLMTTASPKVGVYVYQHVNYKGDVKYFPPGSFVDLGGGLWNDQISSMKVVAFK